MFKSNFTSAVQTIVAGSMLGVSVVACQPSSPPPAYPVMPPPSSPAPSMEMIPAGAQTLSEGSFSQVAFKVPDQPGLLYIVDKDTSKVVVKTNVVSQDAGKSMTMADLKNVTQGLDSTHMYKIQYVPSSPTTEPAKP